GLWSSDTTLRFYRPRNPEHVSHSVVNLQRTSEWFEAPCRSVSSLMAEFGHPSIDLLKVDIEGAEHAVIASVLEAGIRPRVVCFEVDQPVGALRFVRTIRRVLKAGYDLVAVDGWNFTFVRQDETRAADDSSTRAGADQPEAGRAGGRARRTSRAARTRNGRPAITCGRSTSTSSTAPRRWRGSSTCCATTRRSRRSPSNS